VADSSDVRGLSGRGRPLDRLDDNDLLDHAVDDLGVRVGAPSFRDNP
jgi:hypothetical protein